MNDNKDTEPLFSELTEEQLIQMKKEDPDKLKRILRQHFNNLIPEVKVIKRHNFF